MEAFVWRSHDLRDWGVEALRVEELGYLCRLLMFGEMPQLCVVKEKVEKECLLHRTWTAFLSGATEGDFQELPGRPVA